MTVRRFLVATAVAVLLCAQPGAALAAAYDGGSKAPAMTAPTRVATIAAVKHGKPTATGKPKHETGIFSSENTPLGLTKATGHATKSSSTVGGGSIMRTLIGLAVVIGAIYAVAWVLRRVKRSKEDQASGSGLHSIATLPLGSGRTLHLVRAGTDVILVGSSEHGVAPIQRYTEEEALANGVLSEYGQESVMRDVAAGFMPDGGAVPAIESTAQWRTIDQRSTGGAPPTIVEALRRLTVRR
jgi:flagellar protein FliO/FliZ